MRMPRSRPLPAREKAGQSDPPWLVGIGASAGGLKALQQFFQAVPEQSGTAFVVILHLDPERESRIAEILGDHARIPVTQVTGATAVEADNIYIIPPGHDLVVRDATLDLRPRGERAEHAPVDLFFRTLAETRGADAVGVVLSGTGGDGSAGIRHIREAGGITVAQSPDEAEYAGMPSSAIATGLVDLVLPSARIPAELLRLRSAPALAGSDTPEAPEVEAVLARIFATMRAITGHDFSMYRRSTVLRRLDRRMRFADAASLSEYAALLESSSAECRALLRDFLISVSSFFRDPSAFEALAVGVADLFQGKDRLASVRAWVVGCATGEEAYSVAMVLAEHAATLDDAPAVQVFATDIDERAYAWARAALYPPAAVANIAPERLERFFIKEPGGYRIAQALRELVLFAGHNVLHDPPFSRIDLISCRNLFIYLQPEAQDRVLGTFHYALNADGLLFLGAAESVGDSGRFVGTNGIAQRLYRRGAGRRGTARVSAADPLPRIVTGHASSGPGPAAERSAYGTLHTRMLEQYAPTSVVVDGRLDVVHMSAGAGRFLGLAEGEPTHSVLGLARDELRRVLRTMLHHAFATGDSTSRRVAMTVDGARRQVTVEVRPDAQEKGSPERFALVVFDAPHAMRSAAASATVPKARGRSAAAVAELEEELLRARDLLDATNAAHDATVAELHAANAELQSINEEQKAATEELETGREEIQSINEELTTINQEHQGTIDELKRTNADLQNLIESTAIGTIFLDRATRIRRFTPAAAGIFNFVDGDQGRPLSHFTHHLDYDELIADAEGVLQSLDKVEREVTSDTGESYIVRISPYRSLDGGSDGVVLTFFDHTAQHAIKEELRAAKRTAESADMAKGNFMATLSHEFRTPLTAIIGYADLLQAVGPVSAVQSQHAERIKVGAWHLADMIDELLGFVKMDAGQMDVESEALDARRIGREAADMTESLAVAKGLSFVLDVPDAAVPLVTDAGKARQVLINLCGNAVKYTDTGRILVVLRAEPTRVVFEVHDTGIGIAPEHHVPIFDRFWQVDGASTRSANGLGIGLAAAREFARLLGGDVHLENSSAGGSTFTFWLPAPHEPE
jgi:two-component system, chemotaxis family, CheB/CheR fusion protein